MSIKQALPLSPIAQHHILPATFVASVFAKPPWPSPVLASGMQPQHIHSLHACSFIWPHVHVIVVYYRFSSLGSLWRAHANLFWSTTGAKPLCQIKICNIATRIVDRHPGLSCKRQTETTCLSMHAHLTKPNRKALTGWAYPAEMSDSKQMGLGTKKCVLRCETVVNIRCFN